MALYHVVESVLRLLAVDLDRQLVEEMFEHIRYWIFAHELD